MLEMWKHIFNGPPPNMPRKANAMQNLQKLGHYTSLCTAKMPERRPPRGLTNNTSPQFKQQQTRRVKQIKQGTEESDHTEESVDAEAALYIKELHEDWANINIIRPMEFVQKRNDEINKDPYGEFWVETTTAQNKVQWLADTGSPRSLMNIDMAAKLQQEIPNVKISEYTETTVYKIFTNNNIEKKGVLSLELNSGSWTAKDCEVLIMENRTNNIMGRYILTKLGITLSAQKKPGKTINLISNIQTEKNIIKWIFHKYPHLCTRLGRSKNHIAKSIFTSQYTPSQHKGRRVPLHLLDKVEQEQKLIDEKQIIKLDKCSDELFISPVLITVKKDKTVKNSSRLQKAKRCHTQKQIPNAKHRPPYGFGTSLHFRKKKQTRTVPILQN